jgi:hypothetical protein
MNSGEPILSDMPEVGVDAASDVLLDLVRQRLDDAMLREIAEADYGADVDAHLEALRRICDQGEIPAPMNWQPREVLELTRWSEPDQPDAKGNCTGTRGHTIRAFACAVLLRAAAEPANDNFFDGENQTLAQLVASALVLGEDVQEATLRFLVWRVAKLQPGEERPFFAFAILLLATLLDGQRMTESRLARLAEWVASEEAREREHLAAFLPPNGEQWLLGLTFFSQQHDVWRRLARRLVAEASKLQSSEVRDQLTVLALRVAEASDDYERMQEEAIHRDMEDLHQAIDEKGTEWFIRDLHTRLQIAGVERIQLSKPWQIISIGGRKSFATGNTLDRS